MNPLPRILTSAVLAGLVLAALPSAGSAQELAPERASAASFIAQHGDGWSVVGEPVSGNPAFVYGGRFALPVAPRVPAAFEAAARQVVDENAELFGFASDHLVLRHVKFLNLARIGSSDKVAVVFDQVVDSIPVFNGSVSILFDRLSGDVLALDSTGVPFAATADAYPTSREDHALAAAQAAYQGRFGVAAGRVDATDFAIVGPSAHFGSKNPLTEMGPTLAYVFELSNPGLFTTEGVPAQARVIVSAEGDLTVFEVAPTAYAAITGNVKGNVNIGQEPNTTTNQEQPPLVNLRVRQNNSSGAILATTDANGDYSINQTGPLTLFFELKGPYARSMNAAGAEASFTLTNVSGSGNNVLFNPTKAEQPTAEVAGFYWVNRFREWVVAIDPTDNTMDFQVTANVNSSAMTCNAYYDGSSINFMLSGGGCMNSAYSDVVLHEEGHWANEQYNGSVTGAFHEGNADAYAYFINDDWCLDHLYGTGCMRSALQTAIKKCPTDGDESCHGGEVHEEGEALASALWAVRARLNTTHGNDTGDAIANELFSAWMNTYNDGQILNVIQDHWLVLDDDNGNLGDLTPHFADITGGFGDYNWPAYPDLAVSFVSKPATNAQVGHLHPVSVVANITSILGTVTGASLYYTTGVSFTPVAMAPTGTPNQWGGLIPGVASPNSVRWYLTATSSVGGNITVPSTAPTYPEIYHAGQLVVLQSFDFEGGSDQGWTHANLSGTYGDQWQRANPANSNEGTDPTAAYSGTAVWGTDLSTGGTDGKYEPSCSGELRSPTFNLSASSTVRLQFRRWLAVEEAIYDQAAIYVNTTQVYVNPSSGHTIDSAWVLYDQNISVQAGGNPSVQIKYRLTSDGGLEFGGWNIDDFKLYRVDAAPSGYFAQYGSGCPGTGGLVPVLSGTGTPAPLQTVSINITNGKPNAFGILLLGVSQISAPLPGGCTLLVGGLIGGGFPLTLNGSGALTLTGQLPASATAGDVYWQHFIADSGSGNGEYSATNGLHMHIQ